MKKGILFLFAAVLLPAMVFAQGNKSDAVFDRFSSIDGVTNLNISGGMLDIITSRSDDPTLKEMRSKVSGIRLISSRGNAVPDFFNSVLSEIPESDFHELVRVREGENDVLLLANMTDDRISELLVLVGGSESVLVSIRGDMTMDDISEMSGGAGSMNLDFLGGFGFGR